MKRRLKRSRINKSSGSFIANNEKLILLLLMFIIGLVFGCLSVRHADEALSGYIEKLTLSYLEKLNSGSVVTDFIVYFLYDFIGLLVAAFFGLNIIGEPVIASIPLIRGMGLGLTLGSIYSRYKLDGLAFSIICIMLPAALTAASLIIACKENMLSSAELRGRLKGQDISSERINVSLTVVRHLILIAVILISSVISSAVTYRFIGLLAPSF